MVEALPTLLDPCVVESSGELASVLGIQVEAARRCRRRAAASSTARPRRASCHTPHKALTGRCRRPASRARGRECGAALAVEALARRDRRTTRPTPASPCRLPPGSLPAGADLLYVPTTEGVSTCRAARAISTWWPSGTNGSQRASLPAGTAPESWRPGDAPESRARSIEVPCHPARNRESSHRHRALPSDDRSTDGRCAPDGCRSRPLRTERPVGRVADNDTEYPAGTRH